MVGKRWSKQEIEYLKENFPNKTVSDLARALNRSKRSVAAMITRCGLRRNWRHPWNASLKYPTVKNMSDVERGYIAGLIDGEGTITFTTTNKRKIPRLRVFIANTSREIVERVREIIGCGSLYLVREKRQGKRGSWHEIWHWQTSSLLDIKNLLQQISPILVGKKQHAQLALEYIDLYLSRPPYRSELTPQMWEIVHKIKRLNSWRSNRP
jgi:hypothetical protein